MYKVIGIQTGKKGVSEKGYDFQYLTIHCVDTRSFDSLEGQAVASFRFNLAFCQDFVIPCIGDNIEVSYNYKGYPNRCFVV